MKNKSLILMLICLMSLAGSLTAFSQVTVTSVATGDWSSGATWDVGVPTTLDDVVIASGHTVTFNLATATVASITVNSGGTFRFQATTTKTRLLNISGDFIVNGTFSHNASSGQEQDMKIGGNVLVGNAASFNGGSGSTQGINITFNKTTAGDQTISKVGTPTTYQWQKIIVDRPNATDRVVCDATIDMRGSNNALQLPMGTFEQTAGTLILPATSATNWYFNYPNGTLKITGSGSASFTSSITGAGGSGGLTGTLIINTAGTVNIGTVSPGDKRLENGGGILQIDAGTVNINGRFSTSSGTTTINGGTITIDPQVTNNVAGTTNVLNVSSAGTFNMTGGVITIVDPLSASGTGREISFSTSATYNISGGVINLGDGVSTTAGSTDGFQVSTHTVPLYNLVINNPSGTNRQVNLTEDGVDPRHLVVKNNLTLTAGTLNANIGTGSNITLGGSFSNSGTFNGSAAATYTFNGTSVQITNILPGTVGSLVLANSSGVTLTNPVTVTGTLTLGGNNSYTTLSNASGYTGLTYSAIVAQATGPELGGSITNLSLLNPVGMTITNPVTLTGMLTLGGNNSYTNLSNVSGYTGLTYAATVAQTTGAELGSSITDLSINNSGGVTLGNQTTVNGTLALTNGNLLLGSSNLTIGFSGTFSGGSAASHVVTSGTGRMIRTVGASNVVYPIGTGTTYNPIGLLVATGAPEVAASVVEGIVPGSANDAAAVNRTWGLAHVGGSAPGTPTMTLQWDAASEGVSFVRATAVSWRHNGTAWVEDGTPTLSGTNPYVMTVVDPSDLGKFVIGNPGVLPIQLASFTATSTTASSVRLDWSTISELNNYGFYVQRREASEQSFTELANSFVQGHGTTNVPQYYSFTDNTVSGGTWFYRLKQVDLDGAIHYTEPIQVDVLTSVTEVVPNAFTLDQNYPNPFNPSTEIRFTVDAPGRAVLNVFNTLGQQVATLYDGVAEPGKFYRVKFDGTSLASGVYFYKLQSGVNSSLKKMLFTK